MTNASATGVLGSDVLMARTELGLTQEQVADALGISKKTAYNWEARGDQTIPRPAAKKFSQWVLPLLNEMDGPPDIPLEVVWRLRQFEGQKKSMPAEATDPSGTADEPADEITELVAREMHDSAARTMFQHKSHTPRELAKMHLEFVDAAGKVFNFLDLAINLGVHADIVKSISKGVVSAVIDSGTYTVLSRSDMEDLQSSVLDRSVDISMRASEASAGRATPTYFKYVSLDIEARKDRAKAAEAIRTGDLDPDDTRMSDQDAADLAAHRGEENVGHDNLPHEP